MNRLQALQFRQEGMNAPSRNELVIIDQALESLIEQTMDYKKQHDENLLVHRRQLFLDLLEGERLTFLEDRLERFKPLPANFTQFVFIVAEINQYNDFRLNHSDKDQNMLKFTLMNLFQELTMRKYGQVRGINGNRIGRLAEPESGG
jgi:hypothetical protein